MPPALKALITLALAALCMFIYIPKLQTENTTWFSVFSTLLPQPPCPPLPETKYPDLASVPRQYPQPHKFRRSGSWLSQATLTSFFINIADRQLAVLRNVVACTYGQKARPKTFKIASECPPSPPRPLALRQLADS